MTAGGSVHLCSGARAARRAITWSMAGPHGWGRRRSGGLHAGSSSLCLKLTHGPSTHMSLDKANHVVASNVKRLGSAVIPWVWENQTHFAGRTAPDDAMKTKIQGRRDGLRVGGFCLMWRVRKGLSDKEIWGEILREGGPFGWGWRLLPAEDTARTKCAWHVWGLQIEVSSAEWARGKL